MTWSSRRSVKLGALRVNLSRLGVSASGGVRGARVNVGPRGTYVSLRAGRFHYRRKLDGPEVASSPPLSEHAGHVPAASVAELEAVSSSESMDEIAERLGRVN